MSIKTIGLMIPAALLLVACGGGSGGSSWGYTPPANLDTVDDMVDLDAGDLSWQSVGTASFEGTTQFQFDGTDVNRSSLTLEADFVGESVTGSMSDFRFGNKNASGTIDLVGGTIVANEFSDLSGAGTVSRGTQTAELSATLAGTFVGPTDDELGGVRGTLDLELDMGGDTGPGTGTFTAILKEDPAP
jgi:hypothetical protein